MQLSSTERAPGPYDGGQAQFLRVPWAGSNLLPLPAGTEHENDFTMLSDVFPTAWHGVELSGQVPGDRVAVFGAGPVGLMAAHAVMLRGASQVFVVDKAADRLALAGQVGATPIDAIAGDPVEQVMDATDGVGVDPGRGGRRLPGPRRRRRGAPRAGAGRPGAPRSCCTPQVTDGTVTPPG